ncbi:cysteine hydrolase family protein [Yersinia aleksiciae]|uniref:cysteine hydrolase family protein n=1 Tax=Yersinia aleksiciae TaxID=263819 RepID=UPI001427DF71|nr:isochorismatase family protein [Yersinia aleksiciae]MDA5497936.1 isochorismatase family protein [Yersinia aleksiciae]NIK99710.1 isochorismatase family protein [Yersinia aleksiciae]WQC71554.1 isochorismatase family protein [Yersinia aleksiciae]
MSKALLIIDMQNFVVDRIQLGVKYYPENSIENMKCIVEKFRKAGKPVIHVRHQTSENGSTLHKNSPMSLPVKSFKELSDEPVFIKNTSSAFSSTKLLSYLQDADIDEMAVIGAVAGFCVNSTVRMGADSGLKMTVIKDAVISFELDKYHLGAEEIHNVTLALLDADFAQVISSTELALD